MAKDGSIIIDTAIDTKGFTRGTKTIRQACVGTTNILKKMGAALGAAFAVRTIVQFGKEAVQLGSDLQEVQNVVDVTFTTMNEQLNEFAKNAATTAGLSETMAKRYAGTFGAMAKSFKFTEAEAFAMSTTLTQLAGDVASFYNITQDEAYTKLKSVFSGETETLKDLGVVMTQSALDAFALANGLGKTTKQMTEQEKVALRYKFVMEQLSGASGDFVRTSGSWANQTRLLKLQFDSLKASIGQGLINALTPVIQVINILLGKLMQLANTFKAVTAALFGNRGSTGLGTTAGEISGVADAYSDAAAGAGNLAENTGKAAKEAKKLLSGLDEIKTFETAAAAGGGGAASADIGAIDVGELVTEPITLDGEIKDALSPKVQAVVDKVKQLFEPLKNIDLTPLKNSLSGLGESAKIAIQPLVWALEDLWTGVLVPLGQWAAESALPAFFEVLGAAFQLIGAVLTPVMPYLTAIVTDFLLPIAEWTGGIAVDVLNMLRDALLGVSDWVSQHQEAITKFLDVISALLVGLGIAFVAASISAGTFGGIVAFLTSPLGIAVAAIAGLIAIGTLLHKHWGDITVALSQMWENIKSKAQNIWQSVTATFSNAKDKAVSIFTDMKTKISNIFTSLKTAIRTPMNGIIGFVNGLVRGIASGINGAIRALNRIRVTVPSWVPLYGGRYFGFNIAQISAPSIPYLATGAVIPPNAPFTAVLGDQKHGRNLEAPEDLIRQIVREESGGNGEYRFVAQLNRRTIFDEMITEAKLRQGRTGKNPFVLA